MLVPYMIISIMGGGTVLARLSSGGGSPLIPYWLGCAIVAVVVTLSVFLGGMRGTVWVNILQTIFFLCFGAVAVAVISHALPRGFGDYIAEPRGEPQDPLPGHAREDAGPALSGVTHSSRSRRIMFPHMAIMCFSARKVTAFKRTVLLYPLAILAIWLPCVFLGVLGAQLEPGLKNPDGDPACTC